MSIQPVLAIHGGAGTISRSVLTPDAEREYTETLRSILDAGRTALLGGASALDAVTLAVSMFEDCPLFNAGRGAVYTSKATHELDAAIMDGATLNAGSIACVHGVRNPIQAARVIMEQSRHVLMVGEGAMDFLRAHGVAFEPEEYFHTEHRFAQLEQARTHDAFGMVLDHDGAAQAAAPLDEKTKMGTVGAVARDMSGALAAATSTGGLTNKLPGRVGDTPLVGAGCYADGTVAVSCTGTGEYFIRLCVGKDVAARVAYRGESLAQAGNAMLAKIGAIGGSGGLIAVDAAGNVVLPFNTDGMYRGCARADGSSTVAIYGDETK